MNMLAEMLLTEPAPIAIWAVLMLLTLPALIVLASPHGVHDPRRALIETVAVLRRRAERRDIERLRQQTEAARVVRYAQEVRVAADQAAHAAQRWQEHWEAAAERADASWRAWQDADARWARCRTTAAFGTPFTVRTPMEYASRERYLHRSVREAVARGELPERAVADALNGRGGWDARLHPVEQELAVQRARVFYLEQVHRAAVTAERMAWHDVQLARRSRESLNREVAVAEARAAVTGRVLPSGARSSADDARRPVFVPAA